MHTRTHAHTLNATIIPKSLVSFYIWENLRFVNVGKIEIHKYSANHLRFLHWNLISNTMNLTYTTFRMWLSQAGRIARNGIRTLVKKPEGSYLTPLPYEDSVRNHLLCARASLYLTTNLSNSLFNFWAPKNIKKLIFVV